MNSPETHHHNSHDAIDKLLGEQDNYTADDGFTRRVMSAIPRRRSVFPRMILLMVAISGATVAAYWMPWGKLPPLDYTQLFSENSKVLSAWLPVVAMGVALVATVVAALRRKE